MRGPGERSVAAVTVREGGRGSVRKARHEEIALQIEIDSLDDIVHAERRSTGVPLLLVEEPPIDRAASPGGYRSILHARSRSGSLPGRGSRQSFLTVGLGGDWSYGD